ncbi:MAG TPA: hypothetical protein ACQGQI_04345 [Xylella sp.]
MGGILEIDKNIFTTAAPLSWIELALYIASNHCGKDIAKATSDLAVAGAQPDSQ